jgi:hypothetical protein
MRTIFLSLRFPLGLVLWWSVAVRQQPYNPGYAETQSLFVDYTASFQRHLRLVEAKHHALIRETLEKQPQYEPVVQTRNRKPLKKPMAFQAEWELRFGPANRFRVFYRVQTEAVILLALGEKEGNRLFVEGEEVEP